MIIFKTTFSLNQKKKLAPTKKNGHINNETTKQQTNIYDNTANIYNNLVRKKKAKSTKICFLKK